MANGLTVDRKEYVKAIYSVAREQSKFLDDSFRELRHKSEMILISWAFIFGGMAGLWQARILNPENTQQIIMLMLVMTISLILAIVVGIGKILRNQTNLEDLHRMYETSFMKEEYDNIELTETILNDHRGIIEQQDKKMARLTRVISISGYCIFIELCLIMLFVTFKNLAIYI